MKHLTNQEVKDHFGSSLGTLQSVFPILKEYLQRQLTEDVFLSNENEFVVNKIKYEYLDEMLNIINNSCVEK